LNDAGEHARSLSQRAKAVYQLTGAAQMDNNTADTDAAINVLVKRLTDLSACAFCDLLISGAWLPLT
jgi:hypothetical protein